MSSPDPARRAAASPALAPGQARELLVQARELAHWLGEPTWGLTVATAAVGALLALPALASKAFLTDVTGGDVGYVGYVVFVTATAWFGGFVAGTALTVAVGFANTYLFTLPIGEVLPSAPHEVLRLITWLIGGAVLSALIRILRRQRDDYRASLDAQERLAGELAARDQRLQLVLAASNTGIWETDLTTRTQHWSPELFAQFGVRGSVAPTFDVTVAAMDEPSRARAQEAFSEAVRLGTTADVEVRITRPDGEVRHLAIMARPFTDPETGAVRLLGSSQDVTVRRLLETENDALVIQENRAKEFQTALIDVLSHELRTPMTTIFGASEMLWRSTSLGDADRASLVDDIHAEAVRMEGLIENLLFLSRAQRGTLEAAHEPVHLGRILPRIIGAEASRWPQLQFRLEMPEEVPVAAGDDTYVERILANLLSNAGKYGSEGGEVDVTVEPTDREVVISVLDRGIGVSAEDARHAFTLFFRTEAAAKHASGSGVGLYVCARLVEAMGGAIEMRPREGGGTVTAFTLELAEATPSDGAPTAGGRTVTRI